MSKDPAFLFYPNDWIGGTMGMTFEEKGAYIELLMMQFNRGHMTTHMIGQTVGQLWVKIQDKFIQDDKGLWFNERLEEEKIKRQNFTKSRYNNLSGDNQYTKKSIKKGGHKGGHMTNHMEDENVNENINTIVDYLNKKTGKNFKAKTTNTRKHIIARLNDGFTVDEFKKVIDTKYTKWINDSKMRDFLRPDTLFGTKFESYLNENTTKSLTGKSLLAL